MPIKILVVDDEPDLELLIRQKFRKQIRDGQLEFVFAEDGVEALERLKTHLDIDIVLTDINMPRMDGLTLLSRIRELDRLLKVVIVSAYGDMDNIRTAMNRGAFDFITKPINFSDLEITLDRTYAELETIRKAFTYQAQLTAIHRELEIARQIQLSILPTTFPAFADERFDLYATMIPAQEVGGDFYDFFMIDRDRLGFVLGDVAGKGVGAALFMAITRTLLRTTALQGLAAHTCVRRVNEALYPLSTPRMFVTVFYGILDLATGEMTYCNAGHLAPYLLRQGDGVGVVPRTGGIGLCLKSDFDYHEGRLTLRAGDTVLLYSDGVTDAASRDHEFFSEERLEDRLGGLAGRTPAETVGVVLEAVQSFSEGAQQSDDVTLLALQSRVAG